MNKLLINKKIIIVLTILLISIFSCGKEKLKPYKRIKLPATGQAKSYHKGDDGDLRKGVKWPKPRFINNGNGTITDRLTGLMWEQKPYKKPVTWKQAFERINIINKKKLGGYSDWRMPNINELFTLFNSVKKDQIKWLNSKGFNCKSKDTPYPNFKIDINYWSSTTSDNILYAFNIDTSRHGIISIHLKDSKHGLKMPDGGKYYFIIGVRSTKNGLIKIPKTGQSKVYHKGDDGDLRIGAPMPKPRFINNSNGTMTDRLTGLVWEKSLDNKKYTWKQAFKRINKLNKNKLGGYSDWRLPNIKELQSLISYKQKIISTLLLQHGFLNTKRKHYWSSNTIIFHEGEKFSLAIGFAYGGISYIDRTSKIHIIAVRGANPPK